MPRSWRGVRGLRQGDGRRPDDGLGVLILLFGSFLQPITILFSLPLSIGGAIIALLITNKSISMPVVIGILMLMGIVTKNAIMLVDFAVEEMKPGHAAPGSDRGSRPQARPADRDDHHRHGGRHVPFGARHGRAASSARPWRSR